MKYEILNRYVSAVQFVAIIDCKAAATDSYKKRLAVLWALKNGVSLRNADLSYADLRNADLRDADLRDADLSNAALRNAALRSADLRSADLSNADLRDADLRNAALRSADLSNADLRSADLSNADLSRADLRRADLTGAALTGADLQYFKLDFWIILDQNPNEVAGLLKALQEGRVDGSTYIGACACLVGTIANLRGVAVGTLEQDSERPAERWFMMIAKGDTPETCFASAKAVEWVQAWLAINTNLKG
jgi:uncharacterized protein YjbI with pentapeptide repeats